MSYSILISNGDLLDKYSILKIKATFCNKNDLVKLKNIQTELKALDTFFVNILNKHQDIIYHYEQLYNINQKIWFVEDNIRKKEKLKHFDDEFISLARNVYLYNDERARIKKTINLLSNSNIIEEKIYESYQ